MYFKRPSFRRGGSTGIGQLTPRKNFQFGTPGFNFLESGLQNELRAQNELRNRPRIGTRTVSGGRQNIPTGGLTKGTRGARLLSQLRGLSIPSASTTGLMTLPFVGPAAMAYANRPRTLEEKKVMQDYGMLDETFGLDEDYNKVMKDRLDARKVGDEISFTDALFMDTETGEYPKILGRTEDRKKIQEQEDIKTIIESDGPAGDQITMLSDEAKGAATEALLKSIEEKKKRVEPGSDDSSITLDPYAEIKKEKDFLSEMLKNEGLERGEIALIAAKAIGTEGSFKDKLDAAVELALPVVRRRNKEDKALTLTAYKSFKEKEKAQAKATADASKPTVGMKELQYQAKMILKSGDKSRGDTQDEVITSLISEKFKSPDQTLRRETLVRAQEKVFESFDDLKDSKKAYDDYVKTKYLDKEKEIDVTDKKLVNLQRQIDENLNIFKLFYDVPEFSEQYPAYVDAFNRLGLKEGGRVKRALGSPDTGEQIVTSETETIGAETAQKPVLKLTYDDLRNRLPQEITDDVVELLANSEEALQDFAYIQTQNDVDSFNIKYGVNLIIPPAPQTA